MPIRKPEPIQAPDGQEFVSIPIRTRESWIDWMPPGSPIPELLSHDELLKALHDRGVDVSPVALEHWRKSGVLPRPVRRWHNGAVRPVYPAWLIGAITHLRQLQEAGKSLEEIAPIMRSWAATPVPWKDPLAEPIAAVRAALLSLTHAADPDAASATVTLHARDGTETFRHTVTISPDDDDDETDPSNIIRREITSPADPQR